jgi:hypothetical protein
MQNPDAVIANNTQKGSNFKNIAAFDPFQDFNNFSILGRIPLGTANISDYNIYLLAEL